LGEGLRTLRRKRTAIVPPAEVKLPSINMNCMKVWKHNHVLILT